MFKTRRILQPFCDRIYDAVMLEKIQNVKIVDSTLREGEQSIHCNFNTQEKMNIAIKLMNFGVDYIEMASPMVSDQSKLDLKEVVKISNGHYTKILTHIRAHPSDVKSAIECNVHGINMYMATSQVLAQYSHNKGIREIIAIITDIITNVKQDHPNMELRFSCEDSFRSNIDDILIIYKAAIRAGVNRIGIADTVGIADSFIVQQLFQYLTSQINTDMEFHCHNDTGSANENAFTALRYGATHIDTTVLGIGERNGITQLGAFLSKLCCNDAALNIVKNKYKFDKLPELERYVASVCNIDIPFNNPITGSAFTHKAGVHSNAAIKNPNSYEVLNPKLFGLDRHICVASKLTGKNAIAKRAKDLGIYISDPKLITITNTIKNIFDHSEPSMTVVDRILYSNREIHPTSSILESTKHNCFVVKLFGHLLDRDIINNIANICTANNVINYNIETHPGLRNDVKSMAFVKIEVVNNNEITKIKDVITNYVNGMSYDDDVCEVTFM